MSIVTQVATSNILPAGQTISASDTNNINYNNTYYLFDQNDSTSRVFTIQNGVPVSIMVEFPVAKLVNSYSVSYPISGSYRGRPASWTLQGSNNSLAKVDDNEFTNGWTTLSSKSNMSLGYETSVFTIDDAIYNKYRLRVTKADPTFTYLGQFCISELKLFGVIKPESYISVTPTDPYIPPEGGYITFIVSCASSGVYWSVSHDNVDWISVTAGWNGTSNGVVMCLLTKNATPTSRQANFSIMATKGTGLQTIKIPIKQEPTIVEELIITPREYQVSQDSGKVSFEVSYFGSWAARASLPWMSISSGSSGTSPGTITCSYTANPLNVVRTGNIIVTTSSSEAKLDITQSAYIKIVKTALSASPTRHTLPYSASTCKVNVSNIGEDDMLWSARVTSGYWATITSGASGTNSGTIELHVDNNLASVERKTTIEISSPGALNSPTNIEIIQSLYKNTISVTPIERSVSKNGGTTSFAVSNSSTVAATWTATVLDTPWLTIVSGASGTNAGTINCSFPANATQSIRSGNIRLSVTNGDTINLSVIQEAADPVPILKVTPTTENIEFDEESIKFGVSNSGTGPMSWTAEVTSGNTWLSITSGSSQANPGTISCLTTKNYTLSSRTGVIRVSSSSPRIQGSPVNITITQATKVIKNYQHNSSGLIPLMTSNTEPSPIVISSSPSINEPFKAFNMVVNSTSAWQTSDSADPAWIKVYSGGPFWRITSYTISSSVFGTFTYDQCPKSWTLKGSDDGDTWSILDTQINQDIWLPNEMRTFNILNYSLYPYYELTITENHSSQHNVTVIGEFELIGSVYNEPTLNSYGSIIPKMNSNTDPLGFIISSFQDHYPENTDTYTYRLFDGNYKNSELFNPLINDTVTCNIMVELLPVAVVGYIIRAAPEVAGSDNFITSWMLQGSNNIDAQAGDGEFENDWFTLDRRVNVSMINPTYARFVICNFVNETPYKKYRLRITESCDRKQFYISEIILSDHTIYNDTYKHNYKSLINDATSNISPGPQVISDSFGNSAAFRIFSTKSDRGWKTLDYFNTGWLSVYTGGELWKVTSYTITTSCASNLTPKAWTLLGSNDNENWTTLETVNDQTDWISGYMKTFNIPKPNIYLYYKLNFTANNGGEELSINALELIGDKCVLYYHNADDFTDNSICTYSCSSYTGIYSADKAFNHTGNSTGWVSSTTTGWIQAYLAGVSWKAIYYTLSARDVQDTTEQVKSWKLKGSNDNNVWTVIDTVKDQEYWVSNEMRTFSISTPDYYKFYRLEVISNNGNLSYVSIGELELIGTECINPTTYSHNTNSLISTMTTNITPYPMIAEASSEDDELKAFKAFTNIIDSSNVWKSNSSAGWLKIYSEGRLWKIISYTVSAAIFDYVDGTFTDMQCPKNWTLEGSNDNASWDVIDAQTGQTYWSSKSMRTFMIENPSIYKYHRLNVSKNNGATSLVIGEVEMIGNSYNDNGAIGLDFNATTYTKQDEENLNVTATVERVEYTGTEYLRFTSYGKMTYYVDTVDYVGTESIAYTTVASGIKLEGTDIVYLHGETNRIYSSSLYSRRDNYRLIISDYSITDNTFITRDTPLYMWGYTDRPLDLDCTNSIVFEITSGEAYDCRLTAWDDVTHSTTLNELIQGDHVRCSATAYCCTNSKLIPSESGDPINLIYPPLHNRVFKGNVISDGYKYFYGDFDLVYRHESDIYGDYLIFKPMLYGIDESISYGVHDFIVTLHYSYT